MATISVPGVAANEDFKSDSRGRMTSLFVSEPMTIKQSVWLKRARSVLLERATAESLLWGLQDKDLDALAGHPHEWPESDVFRKKSRLERESACLDYFLAKIKKLFGKTDSCKGDVLLVHNEVVWEVFFYIQDLFERLDEYKVGRHFRFGLALPSEDGVYTWDEGLLIFLKDNPSRLPFKAKRDGLTVGFSRSLL